MTATGIVIVKQGDPWAVCLMSMMLPIAMGRRRTTYSLVFFIFNLSPIYFLCFLTFIARTCKSFSFSTISVINILKLLIFCSSNFKNHTDLPVQLLLIYIQHKIWIKKEGLFNFSWHGTSLFPHVPSRWRLPDVCIGFLWRQWGILGFPFS